MASCKGANSAYGSSVGIVKLLDELPEAITRPPARLWSVFARSLGEQGAAGRTALAWRWALTGSCPSPVTLTQAPGRPPAGDEILGEADAPAELARTGIDPGGQVMQARFVLQWLAGEIDAVPLWNGGPDGNVTDGAAFPHTRTDMEEVYFWALLAKFRYLAGQVGPGRGPAGLRLGARRVRPAGLDVR